MFLLTPPNNLENCRGICHSHLQMRKLELTKVRNRAAISKQVYFTHRYREQTSGYQWAKGRARGKTGLGD